MIERFEQVAVGMRLACAGHGVEISAGGDINDGHTAAALQFTGGLNTVELPCEVNVHQDKIRAKLIKALQSLLPGGTDGGDHIAQFAESRGHVTANEPFVLDDQDADAIRISYLPDCGTILTEMN